MGQFLRADIVGACQMLRSCCRVLVYQDTIPPELLFQKSKELNKKQCTSLLYLFSFAHLPTYLALEGIFGDGFKMSESLA